MERSHNKLRIAEIAPLWFPIPPVSYGGVERVISYLTETLVSRGHDVTLFAAGNSKTSARLVATREQSLVESGIPWTDTLGSTHNASLACRMAGQFDVIHSHIGMWSAFFQPFIKTPMVHTLHNIPREGDWRWEMLAYYAKNLNPVFVSRREVENSPIFFSNANVIYNGIDCSLFKFSERPENHFAWIARIAPEKGIEHAIEACSRIDAKLLLAGQIQDMKRPYFEQAIMPRLNGRIKYVGELPQHKLSDFYGSAKALLYPIEWEEPFGLVVVEAMACGTPVIAFRRGAMQELIEDGRNGFLVENVEEMVEAMKEVPRLDRRWCRKSVEQKFSKDSMAREYEKIYYALAEKKPSV